MRQFPPKQGQRISLSPFDLVKPEIFLQNLEELHHERVRGPFVSALVTGAFPCRSAAAFFKIRNSLAPKRRWAEQLPPFWCSLKFPLKNEGKQLELDFHTGTTAFAECWQLQLL